MNRLEKYAPPGAGFGAVKNQMIIAGIIYCLLDLVLFSVLLEDSWNRLYDPFTRELLENAQMKDFRKIWNLDAVRLSWIYTMYCLPASAINYYGYFRRSSKSVYTMARIRSPWELHIRCWTVPLLATAALVLGRVLLRVILFAIYVLATPVGVPKPGFEQLIGGLL